MYGHLTQRIIITERDTLLCDCLYGLSYRWFPDSESSIKDNLAEYFQKHSSLFASQRKAICEFGKRPSGGYPRALRTEGNLKVVTIAIKAQASKHGLIQVGQPVIESQRFIQMAAAVWKCENVAQFSSLQAKPKTILAKVWRT